MTSYYLVLLRGAAQILSAAHGSFPSLAASKFERAQGSIPSLARSPSQNGDAPSRTSSSHLTTSRQPTQQPEPPPPARHRSSHISQSPCINIPPHTMQHAAQQAAENTCEQKSAGPTLPLQHIHRQGNAHASATTPHYATCHAHNITPS